MGDKRIYDLTKIDSAPANGVLPIDVPGSEEAYGISVANLFKESIIERGQVLGGNKDSVDNALVPGLYFHGSGLYGTGNVYHGILFVIKSGEYIAQIDFSADGRIYYRWRTGSWVSINITGL